MTITHAQKLGHRGRGVCVKTGGYYLTKGKTYPIRYAYADFVVSVDDRKEPITVYGWRFVIADASIEDIYNESL
jgi:hypothetical protein